jgi:hypothetical protein
MTVLMNIHVLTSSRPPRLPRWGLETQFQAPIHSDTLAPISESRQEKKLHELLSHPAIQAGLLPFIVALVTAELFQRLRLSGLCIIAGFAATVYFASDFGFEPLTPTHKIIWLAIATSAIAIPLTLLTWEYWRPILSIIAAGTSAWVSWHSFQQQSIVEELILGAGCAIYTGWLVYWFDGLQHKSVAAGNAGLALGVGTGMAALLSASALFGKFGLALGAASAAYLLIQGITNSRLTCGYSFTLPLSLIAGLVASISVISAHQPWYTLPALALIPLAANIPVPERWNVWLQTLALTSITFACAGGAIYLAWQKPF